ncbi:FmdB family zinc ribbon protein [Bdellovibrionota bacterium FG-2]
MPLYEYECAKCEKVHEIMQKFSDAPVDNCPDCASPVKKLLSRTSFVLKGTGWYTTDYKKGGASAPSPTAAATTPAATESAPAATAPAAAAAPATTPAAPAAN